MTDAILGNIKLHLVFILGDIPSANTDAVALMSSTATSQQGAIQMLWHHFLRALTLAILIYRWRLNK